MLPVRPIRSATLVLVALVMGSGVGRSAAAVMTITFETLPGPDGRLYTTDDVPIVAPYAANDATLHVTDQYIAVGILFDWSSETFSNVIVNRNEDSSASVMPDNAFFSGSIYDGPPGSLSGQFLVPVRSFSLELVFNVSRYVTIYSASGKIGELWGGAGFRSFVASEDIIGFHVGGDYGHDHFGTAIDNVSFTVVPEPATLAFAAGVALAARRLRRVPAG